MEEQTQPTTQMQNKPIEEVINLTRTGSDEALAYRISLSVHKGTPTGSGGNGYEE